MSKDIKNVLIGIVIGAIVLAGGQYAWSSYQINSEIKEVSTALEGLKTKAEKNAYIKSVVADKSESGGVSVGLSNSSADEGDQSYCLDLLDLQTGARYAMYDLDDIVRSGGKLSPEQETTWWSLMNDQNALQRMMNDANCFAQLQ